MAEKNLTYSRNNIRLQLIPWTCGMKKQICTVPNTGVSNGNTKLVSTHGFPSSVRQKVQGWIGGTQLVNSWEQEAPEQGDQESTLHQTTASDSSIDVNFGKLMSRIIFLLNASRTTAELPHMWQGRMSLQQSRNNKDMSKMFWTQVQFLWGTLLHFLKY